jgi:putative MATE family efflux protein
MVNKRIRKINNTITNGNLRTSLWKLSVPMMAGALLQNLFSLVDLFFVGRLGYEAVAALSISGVILAVAIMVAMGLSTGTMALIAHYVGKKDYASADNVLFQTLILNIICSAAMLLVGIFYTVPLLRLFGTSAEIIPSASVYLRIIFSYSIFLFLFFSFNQALRGAGDAVVPLKLLIIANIINIILDPLFIFGIGFFPKMGIAGSAIATVISRAVGVIFLLRHMMAERSSLHFHRGIFKINFPIMGKIVRIGFFSSLEVLLRQVSLLLLIRFISSFGVAALAAYGIVIRLRMVIMMLGFGMAGAAGTLIGQNMGAGLPERAVKSGWKALKYYEIIIFPIALLFFIFPGRIVSVFSNHPEVILTGSVFLRFMSVTFCFLAASIVMGRGINGAGDTLAPAVLTGVTQLGLRIPLAYFLAFIVNWGINGIWVGINISDIFQGLLMIWYFKKGYWKDCYKRHRAVLEQENIIIA